MLKKRARAAGRTGDTDSEEEESDGDRSADEDEVDDLFRTTGGAKKAPKRGLLNAGEVDIDRVRDANQAEATSVSRVWLSSQRGMELMGLAQRSRTSSRLDFTLELKSSTLPPQTAAFASSKYVLPLSPSPSH